MEEETLRKNRAFGRYLSGPILESKGMRVIFQKKGKKKY